MKKLYGLSFVALFSTSAIAQTATDWTANDCDGNSHTLFTELDAGKVVVIVWPMPCSSCIAPTVTVSNTVSNMANPNVVFYMVDDYGSTSCATLLGWANTYGIVPTAIFDNNGNVIDMTNYGTAGMPKTVVLGGWNHSVFFNVNGTVSQTTLQNAINNALAVSGTNDSENNFDISVYPNPAQDYAKINYTLNTSSNVEIEIINSIGEIVNTVNLVNQPIGLNEYYFSLETLPTGIYFMNFKTNNFNSILKLMVNKN